MTNDDMNWNRFWDLIKDIRQGMFTARHKDGRLHSRPMATVNGRNDRRGVLWFFMARDSEPAIDIGSDPVVNVAYGDPQREAYVSVSGRARVVDDLAKKKALWSPAAMAWFPEGPTARSLALVAVTIEYAEYWDIDGNKAIKLFEITKAALTGTPPEFGEHEKLRPH